MNVYNFKLQQMCYLGFTIFKSFDLYNITYLKKCIYLVITYKYNIIYFFFS